MYSTKRGGLIKFCEEFSGEGIAKIFKNSALWKFQILEILTSSTWYKLDNFDGFVAILAKNMVFTF